MGQVEPTHLFELTREVVLKNTEGREVVLTESSPTAEATPGLYRLAEAASAAWPGAWNIVSFRASPKHPAPWGGAPGSAEDYEERVVRMIRQAEAARISGSDELASIATGWLPVLEIAVTGFVALMEPTENRSAALRITQIKEKFGTLRFYVHAKGSDKFLAEAAQVALWAELCSQDRCMLSGLPGTLRQGSWLLTLSDDAARLRAADPDTFAARLYPS